MNFCYVNGRLTEKPVLRETENGQKVTTLMIEVPRKFKNINGEYSSDYIKCTFWNHLAEETVINLKKDDIVIVKGKIKSKREEINETNVTALEITGEQIASLDETRTMPNLESSVVLVGRVAKDPQLHRTEAGKKVSNVVIAIPREYKNSEGVYETDFVSCTTWAGSASMANDYIKKGDLIGIRGHLRMKSTEINGSKTNLLDVVATKFTFLAMSKTQNEESVIEEESILIEDDKGNSKKTKKNTDKKKKEPELEVA